VRQKFGLVWKQIVHLCMPLAQQLGTLIKGCKDGPSTLLCGAIFSYDGTIQTNGLQFSVIGQKADHCID
jgi:hypothetical protein